MQPLETNVPSDPELERIVSEEEACLDKVHQNLARRRDEDQQPKPDLANYDVRLLDLRDQIANARLEDIPPLVQEMERLQMLANHLRESEAVEIDTRSPYFGRMVLEEGPRQREVLIGRATYLDTKSGVRIVDWRDAPVSRLYYRYEEGDDYEEVFGEREISGTVVTRRSVSINDGTVRRIGAPQGTFVRGQAGYWRRLDNSTARLTGGAGKALRAEQHHRPGKLGVGGDGTEDKHLKEITALIDARQFDLITRSESGLVVIQGGAGSGKTTIGLHRMAYLAFRDARRFRPDRMLVVVFNDALVRYISQVLPALGINGVAVRTYVDWARRLRESLYPRLPNRYHEDTPGVVTRLKKHPVMLRLVERYVDRLAQNIELELEQGLASMPERKDVAVAVWRKGAGRPLAHRLHTLEALLSGEGAAQVSADERVTLERITRAGKRRARDVVGAWADLLSDRQLLGDWLGELVPGEFRPGALDRAHAYCAGQCHEVVNEAERKALERPRPKIGKRHRLGDDDAPASDEDDEDDDPSPRTGVDGMDLHEAAALDVEDDTLLLLLHQKMRGLLTRGSTGKDPIVYEHVLIDEAQDYSPVELSVIFDTVSKAKSITLAGDVQQRLLLDNGFSDWNTVLGELGLSHVEIEPLKLSYRSTSEIVQFARSVLGPLASADEPVAPRHGAPVELFEFAHAGDAVAHLAESLRELMQTEPSASVAVIARHPEQADAYYHGLFRAEVPYLRRVADQDFSFKAGIDVTDVRQVKGLEFDYVVIVDVSDSSFGTDDEARHLLHIGATRAAHQLWVLTAGKPSPLLPEQLLEAAP